MGVMEPSCIFTMVVVTWLYASAEQELYNKEGIFTVQKLYPNYSVELERLTPKVKWKNKWANNGPDLSEEE